MSQKGTQFFLCQSSTLFELHWKIWMFNREIGFKFQLWEVFFWNFILLLSLSYFYWSQVFLITGNKPPFYSLPTEKIRSTRFLLIKLILTEEKIIKHKRNYSWIFFFCFVLNEVKQKKKREKKRGTLWRHLRSVRTQLGAPVGPGTFLKHLSNGSHISYLNSLPRFGQF